MWDEVQQDGKSPGGNSSGRNSAGRSLIISGNNYLILRVGITPVGIGKIRGTHWGDLPRAIEKGFKLVILFLMDFVDSCLFCK